MPDRIVRAGIITSDAVNQLSWPAEVFYRRLFSIVDDFGRYDGRTTLLRSHLYPLKIDRVSDADVGKWLTECVNAGLVSVYQVSGRPFLEVIKFNQRMRAAKSKWPAPEEADVRGQMPASVRHVSSNALGDGGVCGDGDGGDLSPAEPGGERAFDRFWRAYPRRVGKRKARQAWNRLGLDSKADIVIRAVEAHKKSEQWQSEGGRFIPHPSTWLNRGGWEDEVEPAAKPDPDNDPYAFRSLTDDELARLSPPQPSDPGYAAYVEAREEHERAQREGGSAA